MDHIKVLGILAITTFVSQIFFSFYYASETVSQNIAFNQSNDLLESITSTNNILKIKLAQATSIETLRLSTKGAKLIPIKNTINLSP